MPIYDQGYQRWKGELQRYPVRWWPILRHGILEVVKKRKYLIILLLSWLGPFARGVQLFLQRPARGLAENLGNNLSIPGLGGLFADGMDFYYQVLQQQSFSVLLFVIFVGSDLIARDRRFNALQIYFSKPLSMNDYILGKLGILGSIIFFVAWLPLMLLWLFALSLSLRADYLSDVWMLPLVATAYVLLSVVVMGLLMLALSSIGRRAIFISVSFILIFGYGPMQGVTEIMKAMTGNDLWGLIRISGNLGDVGRWWFGLPNMNDYHPALSLALLVAICALAYQQLRRRIRPIEVVL